MTPDVPLAVLDDVDSTSSEVARRLAEGRQLPFAVQALRQSKGRGSHGRDWVSPAGNLYLSLAIEKPKNFLLQLIPLAVGVAICRWAGDNFFRSVRLKWPNDLVIAGVKCGGILCEASQSGSKTSVVTIGIGLNLTKQPLADEAFGAACEDLGIARQDGMSHEALGRSLVSSVMGYLCSADSEQVIADTKGLLVGDGSLWFHESSKGLFRQTGLLKAGQLRLESLATGEVAEVQSVGGGFRWTGAAQSSAKPPILLADQGNTRTKFYVASRDTSDRLKFEIVGVGTTDEAGALAGTLRAKVEQELGFSWGHGFPIHFASVVPGGAEGWKRVLEEQGFHVCRVAKRRSLSFGTYPTEQIGVDRLAFVEGWLAEQQLGGELKMDGAVLCSLGTTTTVDVVDGSGHHKGGVIFPGIDLALRSLHDGTGALPHVDRDADDDDWLGRNGTTAAIAAGIRGMTVGGIREILRCVASDQKGANLDVVLTGGAAHTVAGALSEARVCDDVIARGLQTMV